MNSLWVEFVSYGCADNKDGILAGLNLIMFLLQVCGCKAIWWTKQLSEHLLAHGEEEFFMMVLILLSSFVHQIALHPHTCNKNMNKYQPSGEGGAR